jgi:hypothetical protein
VVIDLKQPFDSMSYAVVVDWSWSVAICTPSFNRDCFLLNCWINRRGELCYHGLLAKYLVLIVERVYSFEV